MNRYFLDGEEVNVIQFDPHDRMYYLDAEHWGNPQWVEADNPRLRIVPQF